MIPTNNKLSMWHLYLYKYRQGKILHVPFVFQFDYVDITLWRNIHTVDKRLFALNLYMHNTLFIHYNWTVGNSMDNRKKIFALVFSDEYKFTLHTVMKGVTDVGADWVWVDAAIQC